MKRAVVVTGAAVVGFVWLISYRTSPHTLVAATPVQSPSSQPPSPSAGGEPSGSPGPSPSPSPAGAVSGSFMGSDYANRFGDVQVRLVISGGRITDVQAVQMPYDRSRSAYISQVAGPMLRTEVLQAQSAQIDIISGATYTSESYAQSVNSALQKAHLA
jgi:uncharacterized protein with FMN-binding domain